MSRGWEKVKQPGNLGGGPVCLGQNTDREMLVRRRRPENIQSGDFLLKRKLIGSATETMVGARALGEGVVKDGARTEKNMGRAWKGGGTVPKITSMVDVEKREKHVLGGETARAKTG